MDLQGVFVKIGVFIKSQRTGASEKIKAPQKSPEKWVFLSPAFSSAPSLHSVEATSLTLSELWGKRKLIAQLRCH